MKTRLLPNGASGIILTTDELAKYCDDANAPHFAGVTLNRCQVQMAIQRAPWLTGMLTETLELNSKVACVVLSKQAQEYETVHECIHFGQVSLSGIDNDSTLLIDPSKIPPRCKDQWTASLALVEIVEQFRPYFEATTPSDAYSFTAREYLTELVAHVLSGDSLMAHLRGWATPQDHEGECTLVRIYKKVAQQDRAQEWQSGGIGIAFLIDLFQQFESGKIPRFNQYTARFPIQVSHHHPQIESLRCYSKGIPG
jgi:hypothetical protein